MGAGAAPRELRLWTSSNAPRIRRCPEVWTPQLPLGDLDTLQMLSQSVEKVKQ